MFHSFGIFGCFWALFVLVAVVFPVWKICEKIGYPGPASLLVFVPIVNIVMIWVLALSDWPIERELRAFKGQGIPPGAPLG